MSRYIVLTFVCLLVFFSIVLVFDNRPQEVSPVGGTWAPDSSQAGRKVDIKPQKIEVKLKEDEKKD
jgi:hypothetical protein